MIKINEIKNKYIYVFMMSGSVHEVLRNGKDINLISKTLKKKAGAFIPEIGGYINSLSITAILPLEEYLFWVNQKRPKTYLLNGKIKTLSRDEIAGSKILKAIEKEKQELSNGSLVKRLIEEDKK